MTDVVRLAEARTARARTSVNNPLNVHLDWLLGEVTRLAARAAAPDDHDPRCAWCGCTDDLPCPGGCTWVPGPMDRELCSRCAATLTVITEALTEAAAARGASAGPDDLDVRDRYLALARDIAEALPGAF